MVNKIYMAKEIYKEYSNREWQYQRIQIANTDKTRKNIPQSKSV